MTGGERKRAWGLGGGDVLVEEGGVPGRVVGGKRTPGKVTPAPWKQR